MTNPLIPWILVQQLLTPSATQEVPPALSAGPMIGAVTLEEVRIWARASAAAATVEAILIDAEGAEVARDSKKSLEEDDLTVHLVLRADLRPNHRYRYRVLVDGKLVADGTDQVIVAPPLAGEKAMVRLVFGSCAQEKRFGDGAIFKRIRELEPACFLLLGDTPYIDSVDLEVQRRRYREFFSNEHIAATVRCLPTRGTWDDHDIGRNDTDGNLPGKENSRRAFAEYHGQGTIGGDDGGIYQSFRIGPVEVFLLDTRWFAGTGPSPVDPEEKTLLGATQWRWLLDGLKRSTAPFKVIASGMIFNGSVRPGKKDHWGTYLAERGALLEFIGENAIDGVVIVTGDIHRTRHLRYPPEEGARYPIDEWITSPLANSVITTANKPHPALVFDAGVEHVFLLLEADTTGEEPRLRCELRTETGEVIHGATRTLQQLSRAAAER